jgi:short-subunit dehydrogenase
VDTNAFVSNFARDFQQGEPKRLEAQIRDIVDTNAFVSGVTVLTGANSGIGYALAKKLNEQGAKLVLVDKNTDRLSEFAHQTVLKVNLAQVDQTLQLANQLKGVKIRCLINNAGVGFRRSLETISMTELYETFHVNMLSPVLLIKELLPQLVQDQTTIVNVASSVAYNPLPQMSLYAASKAFISILSEALSYELRRTNRVLTVSPGGTWTNFQSSGGVAVQQGGKGLLSPEYVASQILGAIDSRKKILILGLKTKILLLVARVLPRSLNVRFWGVLFEQLR